MSALLKSASITEQILAARTLSCIRRTPVIESLLDVADHPNITLRTIAIETLGSFHDARITPVLIAATQDEPAVSKEAIRALSRRRDLLESVDLIGPLSLTLQSADMRIAQESAIALGRLGTPSAIAPLAALLSRPSPTPVKIIAARALGWIGTPPAMEALAEAFDYGPPIVLPAVQQEIAQSLSQAQAPQIKHIASPPLIDWLKAFSPAASSAEADDDVTETPATSEMFALKQTVISALSRLGDCSAIDSLVRSLADPDPRIRMHILSALKQIDPRAAQDKIKAYLTNPELSPYRRQLVEASLSAW